MRTIIIFITSFIVAVNTQAQEPIPYWATNEPIAPQNANYVYVSGMGIGNTESDAVEKAWNDALKKSMSRGALLEYSNDGVDVLRNRIARNLKCQTPAINIANGQMKIYVLFQIPKRASEDIVDVDYQFNCRDDKFERDFNAWNYGKYPFSPRVFIPGMAQIYKGNTGKGVFFISGHAVLIGGIVATESLRASNESKIASARNMTLRTDYINNANMYADIRNGLIAGTVALYAWNVIDGMVAKGKKQKYQLLSGIDMRIMPYASLNMGGMMMLIKF